jgi:hypothetical protein
VVTENPSEQKSRDLADVPMMKATNFGQLNDLPEVRPLDSSRLRGVTLQRQVTA